MNLATMKAMIIRELHQDMSTVSTTVSNDVTIAIIEAINQNRRYPFHFNTGRYFAETVPNQYFVELPKKFLGVIGSVYYTPVYGNTPSDIASGSRSAITSISSGARYPMMSASVDMIEEYRLKGTDYGSESSTGRSNMYAIDTSGMPARIILNPVPTEIDQIDFRMIYDLGTPDMIYASNTWNFYEPGTETAISEDTFSTDWFRLAPDLIKYRALYVLWSGVYGGTEEAGNMAMIALGKWKEAYTRLVGETNRMTSSNRIRPWI